MGNSWYTEVQRQLVVGGNQPLIFLADRVYFLDEFLVVGDQLTLVLDLLLELDELVFELLLFHFLPVDYVVEVVDLLLEFVELGSVPLGFSLVVVLEHHNLLRLQVALNQLLNFLVLLQLRVLLLQIAELVLEVVVV